MPELTPTPMPRRDRMAAGRALRQSVPRSAHAEWAPGPDRVPVADVVDLANADRLPELVPIRHQRMGLSPFTFYRGGADLMANDLAPTPVTGIDAQLSGDCHLDNFGLFASAERRLVFDQNDFDETARGPWEWDLKRLATSFEVVGRQSGFAPDRRRAIVAAVVHSYRVRIAAYARVSPLDARYDRRDLDEIVALADPKRRREGERLSRRARRRVSDRMYARLTEVVDGRVRITDDPPLRFHIDTPEMQGVVDDFLETYRESLRPETRIVFDRYHVADIVVRVGGVGSVGTRCFLALFLSDDGHPLFLQVKEAGGSALAPFVAAVGPTHAGERVVVGQRILQGMSDIFLGWGTGREGREFYVRQAQDMKYSLDVSIMDPAQLTTYGEYCGWVLARAHAVSADAATIAGYVGRKPVLDEALASFAVAYADQNERDHAEFLAAIASGRLAG